VPNVLVAAFLCLKLLGERAVCHYRCARTCVARSDSIYRPHVC
jgi:hypothetical protein